MQDIASLDPQTSALLVMDYQNVIVQGYAPEGLVERTAGVIDAARAAGMRVIYVVVGFREGFPEISPNNARFAGIRQSGRFDVGSEATKVHEAVAPAADEPVVTKHRVGAFFGTDLDMILRANNIQTLVLAGIATSGVVLSTLRHAADADYRIVVVEDCCADRDEEVHRVLVDKVFPTQATITDAQALVDALG